MPLLGQLSLADSVPMGGQDATMAMCRERETVWPPLPPGDTLSGGPATPGHEVQQRHRCRAEGIRLWAAATLEEERNQGAG